MKNWKVGIAYTRYGYLNVEADTREEAVQKADKWLEGASLADMDEITDYLQDSEEVDEEFVEVVS